MAVSRDKSRDTPPISWLHRAVQDEAVGQWPTSYGGPSRCDHDRSPQAETPQHVAALPRVETSMVVPRDKSRGTMGTQILPEGECSLLETRRRQIASLRQAVRAQAAGIHQKGRPCSSNGGPQLNGTSSGDRTPSPFSSTSPGGKPLPQAGSDTPLLSTASPELKIFW